jgi:protein transport protein SEC24
MRCRRCRAYINCHCRFVAGGNQYVCSICHFVNDVPQSYFSPLNPNGTRHDYVARPELSRGSVDFVATSEYMARTPAPAAFVFVIDVSAAALAVRPRDVCGALHSRHARRAAQHERRARRPHHVQQPCALLQFARVAIAAGDARCARFAGRVRAAAVGRVPGAVQRVPRQARAAARAAAGAVRGRQGEVWPRGARPGSGGAGAALADVGGKVLLFASSLPTVGGGTLQPRDNPALYGTPREEPLVAALKSNQGEYYAELGKQLVAQRARVDLFMLAPDFVDLATLSTVSHATGGEVYHYPAFDAGARRRAADARPAAQSAALLRVRVPAAHALLRGPRRGGALRPLHAAQRRPTSR